MPPQTVVIRTECSVENMRKVGSGYGCFVSLTHVNYTRQTMFAQVFIPGVNSLRFRLKVSRNAMWCVCERPSVSLGTIADVEMLGILFYVVP